MITVGKRSKCYGLDNLQHVSIDLVNRPTEMPELPEGHALYAVYHRVGEEDVVICETLEDIQSLWKSYNRGAIITIAFGSTGDEVGTLTALSSHVDP
jgi:hypothetical protein